MSIINHQDNLASYITRDGSEIKELMHPDKHGNKNQSLAEAIVKPGCSTLLHLHHKSEELYYITQGKGIIYLGETTESVYRGHVICIPPNTPHKIENTGHENLTILCCCSPAYSHNDTELL